MGKECALFVCKEYPDDVELKIFALGIELHGIEYSQTSSMEEQECAAEEVLSAIEESYSGEELPAFVLHAKMDSHFMLGNIDIRRKDFDRAIKHFKQCEDAAQALGYRENDIEMMEIRKRIAGAQCVLRVEDDVAYHETLLPFTRAIFAKSKEVYGEDSEVTLGNGYHLATTLCELDQINEAKELLADLHAKAQRVFGTHHYGTQDIKCLMDEISTSRVDC